MKNTIKTQIDLGMSTGEVKTYSALVLYGPSEATPLSKLARVHQLTIYKHTKEKEERKEEIISFFVVVLLNQKPRIEKLTWGGEERTFETRV